MSAVRSSREGIRGMLADLKMPGSLEAVDAILSDIDGGRVAASEAISRLLAAQITATVLGRRPRLVAVVVRQAFVYTVLIAAVGAGAVLLVPLLSSGSVDLFGTAVVAAALSLAVVLFEGRELS